ncbi:hypothetical protein [Actibacterium sp. MT2.3-13A]|uniref:hypothetical protein n=1 Tax=Actibacterium sp. MT2.3-13A TaxID=2828332 RepID=UPI001BA55C90|nr:hypothetical protein [Actibacterium sp. MT2.3-13A]
MAKNTAIFQFSGFKIYMVVNDLTAPEALRNDLRSQLQELCGMFRDRANAIRADNPALAESYNELGREADTALAEIDTADPLLFLTFYGPEEVAFGPQSQLLSGPIIRDADARIACINANRPGMFEVSNYTQADPGPPWHMMPIFGRWAVRKYATEIEDAAKQNLIPADALRAIIYLENAHGYYDAGIPFRLRKSLRPANIYAEKWKEMGISKEDLKDPVVNIRLAAHILHEFWVRTIDPNFAKVASLYNFSGAEYVSDYGARADRLRKIQPWKEGLVSSLIKSLAVVPEGIGALFSGTGDEGGDVQHVTTEVNRLTHDIESNRQQAETLFRESVEAAQRAHDTADATAREAARQAAEAVRQNEETLGRLVRELELARRDLAMLTEQQMRRQARLQEQMGRAREMQRIQEEQRRQMQLDAQRRTHQDLETARRQAEQALREFHPAPPPSDQYGPPTVVCHPRGWTPDW